MKFPGTNYDQVLQAIAQKHGSDVSRITTEGPPDGDLSVYLEGKFIGILSFEFDHNDPNWKEKHIKTDWTFKAIENGKI